MTGIRPRGFQALPVGQGDAFLLQRSDDVTVLVDGGGSRETFASLLGRFGRPTSLDVVVCTHADADHTKGVLGLLESNHFRVKEVWLPGRWTDRLIELCTHPYDFVQELYEDVRKSDAGHLEQVVQLSEEERDVPPQRDTEPEGISHVAPASLTEAFESAGTNTEALAGPLGIWPHPWALFGPPDRHRAALWIEAITTAARIRDIALAAHHHGSVLRWFDFVSESQKVTPSGGEPFLRPVNSVELLTTWRTRKPRALPYLALSLANKQSLVFVSPETESDSAVLFSADSDLGFSLDPLKASRRRRIIATAPHHGSEANAQAYDCVSSAIKEVPVLWIRSDGRFASRPGARFLKENFRACTLCRGANTSKSLVSMIDTANGWSFARGQLRCHCK